MPNDGAISKNLLRYSTKTEKTRKLFTADLNNEHNYIFIYLIFFRFLTYFFKFITVQKVFDA